MAFGVESSFVSSWLDELNAAQRDAVTHTDGPLLIVAGAGTGKTKTLACRVASLIERGVKPDRILLLTFTRRSASEMLRRAGSVTDRAEAGRVWGGTFHATANRLLRTYAKAVGLTEDFTVLDQGDAVDLMQLIRQELGVAKKERRFPRKQTLQSIYSRMVNAQESLEDSLANYFPWCSDDQEEIAQIFDGYAQRKRDQHLLDFDDLLLFWSALCSAPRVGATVAARFDHVLVDEYQDTNPIQAEILRKIRKENPNICAVGDDAQSIYSFRAATVRNMLDFPDQFPGATIVRLEKNYRSTQAILAASNAVMEQAKERYTKELWTDRQGGEKPILLICQDESGQVDSVCRRIIEHLEQGVPLMQQAVLFRASSHSAQLEVELARRNIPFHKFGGLKYVDTAHVKDMLAVLRVLENPFDELSWFRILQHFEGIGPRWAGRLIESLGVRRAASERGDDRANGDSSTSPLDRLLRSPPKVPAAAEESFERLRQLVAACSGANGQAGAPVKPPSLAVQIELLREFYEPIFKTIYDNAAVRLRDVEQLALIASRYRSRRSFLTDLTLDPPNSTADLAQAPHLEEDWITLSTIHSAKGCEWSVVHIIHVADGMIPSDMALSDEAGVEEERRLLYVAMTRAKNNLYAYFPLRYHYRRHRMGDDHLFAQPSRFLTSTVRSLFQECADGGEDVGADAERDNEVSSDEFDPYDRVSRLWKT